MSEQASRASSIDPAEVAKFNAMAKMWWDPHGAMKVLHRFNPARLNFIRDSIVRHRGDMPTEGGPLSGLSILDIGCGGGLVCEPLARLGAQVTGIDPAERNVRIAAEHAETMGLGIAYEASTLEDVVAQKRTFNVVLALEVIEHVANPQGFTELCAQALSPGGLLIMATLNRTIMSFALAIVGAEYVLRWLPRGTHSWNKFITPDEMKNWMTGNSLRPVDETGVVYKPLSDTWVLSSDMQVNYMIGALKS